MMQIENYSIEEHSRWYLKMPTTSIFPLYIPYSIFMVNIIFTCRLIHKNEMENDLLIDGILMGPPFSNRSHLNIKNT